MNKIINKQMNKNPYYKLLKTIPGIGNVFASIIALEVDNIDRFPTTKQFWAYSGLAPSTHSSGQSHYHGKLIRGNKWLRWTFVEASHTSNRVSIYFKQHHYKIKRRKDNNAATISTARKLAEVVFYVLKNKRKYTELYKKNIKGRLPSDGDSQFIPDSFQV